MGIKLKLEAPWDEVKEQIKEHVLELTDEDLLYEPGREEELLSHLASIMGRTPDQIKILIESISSNKGRAS